MLELVDTQSHFNNVTLLVTHYNRSSSLERLLRTFQELNCSFADVVVSDDCSKPEHLDVLRELSRIYRFNLITTPVNKGLGNNINKGQDAVKTPYTLYVQEDFVPTPLFPEKFRSALQIMEERPDFDIIRFYSYLKYPYLKPYKDGFSEMYVKPWFGDYRKIYFYSDHPHLRRTSFLEKFGRYAEGRNVDRTEYRKCINFIQKRGKGLFYDNFKELFIQMNSETEPSSLMRSKWTRSNSFFIRFLRDSYRQIRYNFDILFVKY